jgi:DNA-binding NtrC family response regulator
VAPKRRLALTPEALALLQAQDFRGNVHEPRTLRERAALAARLGISERSLYRKLKALDTPPRMRRHMQRSYPISMR